jgi:hypothetical protein
MKLNFQLEFKEGTIWVTSPNVPGLLVSAHSLSCAFGGAEAALNSLLLAAALEMAQGRIVGQVVRLDTETSEVKSEDAA